MRTRLIKIGNSRGVRLPKPLIEEAGLTDQVDVTVKNGAIMVAPMASCRSGWSDAAKQMRERGEVSLLDPPTPTRFDEEEWDW
jgi:antitoxin MazE